MIIQSHLQRSSIINCFLNNNKLIPIGSENLEMAYTWSPMQRIKSALVRGFYRKYRKIVEAFINLFASKIRKLMRKLANFYEKINKCEIN